MSHKEELEIVGRESDSPDSTNNGQHESGMSIATSRSAQEVQAAMIIAKRFPRNEEKAFARIMQGCKRKSLAEQAIYSYPRGDTQVEGPSIRLAEEMARAWGNVDFGIIELEQREGESICMSYAWDLETNTRQTKIFTIQHVRVSGRGVNKKRTMLDDPRDIYEMTANQGARRLRACILGIIPGDFVDAAVEECNKTLSGGEGTPLIDRVRKMVAAFGDFGVTAQVIEKRLSHKLDATSEAELAGLRKIYMSIRDGQGSRESYFDFGDQQQQRPTPPPPKADQGVAAATAEKKEEPPPATEQPAQEKKTRAKAPAKTEQKQAETPAPEEPEAPKEEKKPEPPKPTKTELQPGEKLTAIVRAEDITTLMISKKASAKIDVSGEFQGVVYHVDGARVDPTSNALAVNPVWQLERPIKVELLGHKQQNGTIIVFVQHAELAEGGK